MPLTATGTQFAGTVFTIEPMIAAVVPIATPAATGWYSRSSQLQQPSSTSISMSVSRLTSRLVLRLLLRLVLLLLDRLVPALAERLPPPACRFDAPALARWAPALAPPPRFTEVRAPPRASTGVDTTYSAAAPKNSRNAA